MRRYHFPGSSRRRGGHKPTSSHYGCCPHTRGDAVSSDNETSVLFVRVTGVLSSAPTTRPEHDDRLQQMSCRWADVTSSGQLWHQTPPHASVPASLLFLGCVCVCVQHQPWRTTLHLNGVPGCHLVFPPAEDKRCQSAQIPVTLFVRGECDFNRAQRGSDSPIQSWLST